MVSETIVRLQRASVDQNDMGTRYACLLCQLWRKRATQPNDVNQPRRTDFAADPLEENSGIQVRQGPGVHHNAFSWLDLDAVGSFAAQNGGAEGVNMDMEQPLGEFDTISDMDLFADYTWLSEENSRMIF